MRVITKEDIETRALTDDEKGWLIQRERQADVDRNEELFDEDSDPELAQETDNYDQWKNRELLAEGGKRVPPVDFTAVEQNKAGYVAALRAWDQEHGE